MRVAKRWLRSPFSLSVVCWLIAAYARLIWRSGRWTIEGREHLLRLHDEGKPTLAAFWHGRILVMPFAWHGRTPFHMLISSHIDGRLIAGAVSHFGIQWIAGSSSEGGGAALRSMLRHLKAGDGVGITPDGPDGPAMRAKPGIVVAGRLARASVAADQLCDALAAYPRLLGSLSSAAAVQPRRDDLWRADRSRE